MATVAREQKEVFMVTYQRFTQVLQALLTSLSAQGRIPDEDWTYWWVHGWFKEVLRLVSTMQNLAQGAHLKSFLTPSSHL
jgi:nuclear cap-binding protein subunit 1